MKMGDEMGIKNGMNRKEINQISPMGKRGDHGMYQHGKQISTAMTGGV